MSRPGLTITACLAEIHHRLSEATAVAKAAQVCAEAGAEREALRIVMDLDVPLNEASTLHAAACLLGRSALAAACEDGTEASR